MSQNQQCDPTQQADIDAAESCADHASLMHSLEEKLIIAICDAHMAKHDYRIEGDHYLYSPINPPMVPKYVSRPSNDGKGGGVFTKFGDPQEKELFVQDFNKYRSRISGILSKYYSLPTGEEMRNGRTTLEDWAKKLDPDETKNTAGLPKEIRDVERELETQESDTINYVKNHMIGKILPAVATLHEATLGSLSLMDKNIQSIKIMRHDTRAAIQAAIDTANAMAQNPFYAEFKVVLKALSFFENIGKILKGSADAAVSTVEDIESWVETVENNTIVSRMHFSPDDILNALESTLTSANNNLKDAENSIVALFNSMQLSLQQLYSTGTITIDQSNPPKDHIKSTSQVTLDWTKISRVYNSDLNDITTTLTTTRLDAYKIRYTTALSRLPSIGRGQGGSDTGFFCVLNTIQDSLKRLAESCEGIAQGLKDFETDIKSTETESQESLDNIAHTIQRYSVTKPEFRQEQVDQPPQKK